MNAIFQNGFPGRPEEGRAYGVFASPQKPGQVLLVLLEPAPGPSSGWDQAWFSPPFHAEPGQGAWRPTRSVWIGSDDLDQFLGRFAPPGARSWEVAPEQEPRFLTEGYQLLHRIQFEGRLRKGVPYAFMESAGLPGPEELAFWLRNALKQHLAFGGYLYAHWTGHEGILGVSPELLFEREPSRIRTVALAGTRSAEAADAAERLLADPKERSEHDWVITGIRESLKPWGEAQVSETRAHSVGSLVHLKTELELQSSGPETEALVQALHPTPALGAYPKDVGHAWLLEQDSRCPRSRFGAPFGVRVPGLPETFVVAIRNVEWSEAWGVARIGAGAGFVAQSDPELEWGEVRRKWQAVRKILGISQ